MKKSKKILTLLLAVVLTIGTSIGAFATSDSNTRTIKKSPKRRIQSNVWIQTWAKSIGNSNRWDYTVSAKYLDNKYDVEWIKTEWSAHAKVRKSTTVTLGIGGSTDGNLTASAGTSSKWQVVNTPKAHWTNGKNKNISDWANTLVINSRGDYRAGSRGVTNTASVKIKGDKKYYSTKATT